MSFTLSFTLRCQFLQDIHEIMLTMTGTVDDWEIGSFSAAGAEQAEVAVAEPARQTFQAPSFDSGSSSEEDDEAPEAEPETPKPQEAAAAPKAASPVDDDDPFADLGAIMAGVSVDDDTSEESEAAAEDAAHESTMAGKCFRDLMAMSGGGWGGGRERESWRTESSVSEMQNTRETGFRKG